MEEFNQTENKPNVFLQEVEKLAFTLQSDSANEAEKEKARKVLIGLRTKSLETIKKTRDIEMNALKDARKKVNGVQIRTPYVDEINYLRALNVALGLEEHDHSPVE